MHHAQRYAGVIAAGSMFLVAAVMGAVAVTGDAVDQCFADADGGAVVWADNRSGDFDIYLFRIADNETIRVTDDPGDQVRPAIDGDLIVWQDDREGSWDIYAFDLENATERPLANGSGDQENPAISGDVVAWQDNRSGSWEIMLASLQDGTEVQVSEGAGEHVEPAVTTDLVVWNVDINGTLNIRAASLQSLLTPSAPSAAPTAGNASGTNASTPDVTPLPTATGGEEAPRAAFSMNRTFGKAPVTIQFFDGSTGEIDEYNWDFGDGETSAEQNPVHRYNESGKFPVILTVANAAGSDSANHTVTVT